MQLLREGACTGKQVHDANIVATMLTGGATRLVTENLGDFAASEGTSPSSRLDRQVGWTIDAQHRHSSTKKRADRHLWTAGYRALLVEVLPSPDSSTDRNSEETPWPGRRNR